MSRVTTQTITASEWLAIRDRVAKEIRAGSPRMEHATAVRVAEHMLRAGVIDLDAVYQQISAAASDQDEEDLDDE